MALDGASTPVASAIATGNASMIVQIEPDPVPRSEASPMACGCTNPRNSTGIAEAMKRTVMVAKTLRPRWPNHVTPATSTQSTTAISARKGASEGT